MKELRPLVEILRRGSRCGDDSTLCSPFDASAEEELVFPLSIIASPIPVVREARKARLFTECDESVHSEEKDDLSETEERVMVVEGALRAEREEILAENASLLAELKKKEQAYKDLSEENEDQQRHIRSLVTRVSELKTANSELEALAKQRVVIDHQRLEKECRSLRSTVRKQQKEIEYFQGELATLKARNSELVARLRQQSAVLKHQNIDVALRQFDNSTWLRRPDCEEKPGRAAFAITDLKLFYQFKLKVTSGLESSSQPQHQSTRGIKQLPFLVEKASQTESREPERKFAAAFSTVSCLAEGVCTYMLRVIGQAFVRVRGLLTLVNKLAGGFWLLERENVRLMSRVLTLEFLVSPSGAKSSN